MSIYNYIKDAELNGCINKAIYNDCIRIIRTISKEIPDIKVDACAGDKGSNNLSVLWRKNERVLTLEFVDNQIEFFHLNANTRYNKTLFSGYTYNSYEDINWSEVDKCIKMLQNKDK